MCNGLLPQLAKPEHLCYNPPATTTPGPAVRVCYPPLVSGHENSALPMAAQELAGRCAVWDRPRPPDRTLYILVPRRRALAPGWLEVAPSLFEFFLGDGLTL